jgi:DNA-binding MarR family transcriptional regulator
LASPPYTLKNYTLEESIGYLLRRTGSQLTQTLDRALADYDMTAAQLGILLKLFHGHANTAAELAREMMCDSGAITRMLDRLEDKEFIKRVRSSEDRRVILVELTDKGSQLSDQMKQVTIDALNHHLRGFSAQEIDQLKDFLRRMIANT